MIGPPTASRARVDAPVVFCRKSHNETSGVTVIARSRQATKQSRANQPPADRDCFASLAMTIHQKPR
jgi:hypothetical protein